MFVWCEKMIYLSMVGVVSYIFSGIYNLDFYKLSKNAWLATYVGTWTNYIGLMVGS